MKLSNNELKILCEIAQKAALKAGEIIKKKQGSNLNVETKEGGENIASCVVTEVDFEAQNAILEILGPTLKEYDLGLLTEESEDDMSRFEKDYFWCIDPLDGTLCFSRDEDGYSTSIALVSKEGRSVIGVVYNPRDNNLYYAIEGLGAFKNDMRLEVKPFSRELTLLYDKSYLKHQSYEEQIEKLKADLKELGLEKLNIFHLGGAVMNGISTIEMAPAIYYKFPKTAKGGGSIWDFAASSIIQSEAGGFNSSYSQAPINLNAKDSTFMNEQGIIYCSSKELLGLIPHED
ncbi:inositol monophosphatase family protein [Bacteriovoracaceae bacterium]|nr:inositol monophosphatase family protein [Bacteriovoracaceae bacterium]